MKPLASLLFVLMFGLLLSCKKESDAAPLRIPQYLTERIWQSDTILINAPSSYDNLTDEERVIYNAALAWIRNKAQLNFRDDGSVNCSGDWDFGFTHWQLINNDKDIKVNQGAGYDTLKGMAGQ